MRYPCNCTHEGLGLSGAAQERGSKCNGGLAAAVGPAQPVPLASLHTRGPQTSQAANERGQDKTQFVGFVRELTFENDFMITFCVIRMPGAGKKRRFGELWGAANKRRRRVKRFG